MTPPALAAARFLQGCLLGIPAGIWYGFLRPLRPRFTALSDLLFLLGFYWCWIYFSFAVCRGDLRLGYAAGLFLGCFGFDRTAGRLLRPLFSLFWKGVFSVSETFTAFIKKIFEKNRENSKNFICIWRKMGYNKME